MEKGGIAVNPDDNPTEQTVQAERVQSPSEIDRSSETLHVHVVIFHAAKHSFIASQFCYRAYEGITDGSWLLNV